MKLRLWPDTLFGRLVMILAIGMFAGQLLTSTIWFDTHENRALEMPARLFANCLADSIRLLERAPDDAQRRALVQALGDGHYRLQLIAAPSTTQAASLSPDLPVVERAVGNLIGDVLQHRLGEPVDVRLLDVQLRGREGDHSGILTLFNTNMPTGDFHLQVKLPGSVSGTGNAGDTWLDVRANEGQAGLQSVPRSLVIDYLVRIYLIRLTAVCVLAFVAVRFAVQPLRQLAKAAEALGGNIYRAPLPVTGPIEVRSAAQSFNSMQQQLTKSLAQRTRFLTAVSHDLRSPLTRLRLRVEMLPDAQWRERLRDDIDDMEAMVRTTLDAVQGVEVTETRHDIDLDSMLEGLAEDAREAGHAVTVEGSAGRPLAGYPRNLKRCLQNMLDNAIRYGESATIRVTDAGRSVQIVVSDRGPGIADAKLLEQVFEPYFRIASSRNEASGGTGLGLTIARSVAAAHGGTLVLRNRAERGLDAVLTLPREA